MKNLIKFSAIVVGLLVPHLSGAQNTFPSSGTVNLGTSTATGSQGIIIIGKNDARIKLIADDNNVGEYYNPFISFSQDVGLVNSVIGNVGNAGKDPQNVTYSSTKQNAFFIGTKTAYPLQLGTNQTVRFTVASNGNVGIGTTAPTAQLEVNNEIFVKASNQSWQNDTGKGIYMRFSSSGSQNATYFQSYDRSSSTAYPLNFYASNYDFGGGAVSIGTTTVPSGYKLAVAGKAIMEEIKVELNTNWPDYVFSDDYQLTSLSQLETYVEENKHLPGIPSQKEVQEEGILLGEMQGKLLEKIEELTLYMIELKNENEALKARMEKLEKE